MLMWLAIGLMVVCFVITIGSIINFGIEIFKYNHWKWSCIIIFAVATVGYMLGAYLFDF